MDLLPYRGGTPHAPGVMARGGIIAHAFAVGYDNGIYAQYLQDYDSNRIYQLENPRVNWMLVPQSRPAPPSGGGGGTPPLRPDLAWVSGPTYNAQTRQIILGFRNVGSANAGPFRVGVNVNNTNIQDLVYNGMAAGQGDTVTFNISPLPAGTYSYNFVLDPYNTVSESNENNNATYGYFNTP